MDPTLIVIVISAIVVVFPLIKRLWEKIDDLPLAAGDAIVPPAQTKVKGRCIDKLMAFAACLPEEEAKKLIKQYAADIVMKELE